QETDPNALVPRFNISSTVDPNDPTLIHFQLDGPGFMVEELPGRVEVNPRAIERLQEQAARDTDANILRALGMHEFSQPSPTINLEEVRRRRFDILNH